MVDIFSKKVFLLASVLIFSIQAFGQQECVSKKHLIELSKDFKQIEDLISPNQNKYCEEDLGRILNFVKALDFLKNNAPSAILKTEKNDKFTNKAIQEKDWWSYFTKRAKRFSIDSECPAGVVAYVRGGVKELINDPRVPLNVRRNLAQSVGTIFLCDFFFRIPMTSQVETLLHEVRHFDGHSHVTCTQGLEEGFRGACDGKLSDNGSYSASVQTLVSLALFKDTPDDERGELESQAVYMSFNKFNTLPEVKLSHSIVLNNKKGEVHKLNAVTGDLDLVTDLEAEAKIYSNPAGYMIFPKNGENKAIQVNREISSQIEDDLLVRLFNSETPVERAKYTSFAPYGVGGALKGNTLITFCGGEISQVDISSAKPKTLVRLSINSQAIVEDLFLLTTDGKLGFITCNRNRTRTSPSPVNLEAIGLEMGVQVKTLFPLGGTLFALLDSGELTALKEQNGKLVPDSSIVVDLPVANRWVSASSKTVPSIVD